MFLLYLILVRDKPGPKLFPSNTTPMKWSVKYQTFDHQCHLTLILQKVLSDPCYCIHSSYLKMSEQSNNSIAAVEFPQQLLGQAFLKILMPDCGLNPLLEHCFE